MFISDSIIDFLSGLNYAGPLPEGVSVMNPFRDNKHAGNLVRQFYTQYYRDHNPRKIILGINPGRFGAGATGIPFTDTIRLNEKCHIDFDGFRTRETSSAFIYDMIDASGGANAFFSRYLISAVCPLGFTRINEKGRSVNYNYYDSPALVKMIYSFIVDNLKKQVSLGIDTSVAYVLGTGKNESFVRKLNAEFHFFGNIIALEHPRFIMQYRAKHKQEYIRKYVETLNSVTG